MSSTDCLVGSSTASRRRNTTIGRITSRYLPRTYRSRSTSSAMPQIKLAIQLSCGESTILVLVEIASLALWILIGSGREVPFPIYRHRPSWTNLVIFRDSSQLAPSFGAPSANLLMMRQLAGITRVQRDVVSTDTLSLMQGVTRRMRPCHALGLRELHGCYRKVLLHRQGVLLFMRHLLC